MRIQHQKEGKSVSLVAAYGSAVMGYINVYLDSKWGAFANQGYPEIVDFACWKSIAEMELEVS